MFTMELIGNGKKIVTTISEHNLVQFDNGYQVVDVGRFEIKEELYLLKILLKEDNDIIGLRVLPIPFNLVPGDTFEMNWKFTLIKSRG